ncbi:MAG: PAS domain S-box protein [Bacteroidetes bacterium]|nr:PAS domain S-box protein [Bacteroidota bacterium]
MKKIIIELLTKYFKVILENWVKNVNDKLKDKLTESQIRTFVESSIKLIIEVIETSDYKTADQYLIDIYNLFSKSNLNLLEISHIFSQGRYAILSPIENDNSYKYDPIILIGFIDEIIEQIYARYGMLHQKAQMQELESDRDRLAAKLETNQQYLSNILHASDSAIMVIDKDENIVAWNKGAEKIFGYSEEEILYQSSSTLLPDNKRYLTELNYIKDETKKNGYVRIFETERKTKHGKILTVQLNVTKLPDQNGDYAGRSVIIKDTTEVKKLQQQIDQSEKLAVIGQVAAGVAHEIGNPLASISSIVQLLQRQLKDDFITEQLSTIKENIDRISRIVRELVDFSRPPGYEKSFIQITDVIKTALGIVKYDKRVHKVNFETSLDPEVPKLNIVPDQLLQVFVNILLNALDAIHGNGTIQVNSFHNSEYVLVEITDNGTGMNELTVERIFDPFFTTKEVGKGTGLGLSVSYGIIKKMNGKIEVKSKLNEGSTFTVKLPLEK